MSVQLPAMVWHDSPYNSSAFPSYFRSWHAEWPEPSNMQHLWFFFSLSRDQRQILLNLQEFEEVLELPWGIEFHWRCETGAWIIVGFLATYVAATWNLFYVLSIGHSRASSWVERTNEHEQQVGPRHHGRVDGGAPMHGVVLLVHARLLATAA